MSDESDLFAPPPPPSRRLNHSKSTNFLTPSSISPRRRNLLKKFASLPRLRPIRHFTGAQITNSQSQSQSQAPSQYSPNPSQSPIHAQFSSQSRGNMSNQQQYASQQGSNGYSPSRSAPISEPSTYDNEGRGSGHTVNEYESHARPGGRRNSLNASNRSSYVPNSRPYPSSSGSGSSSSNFLPSRAPPQPPTRILGTPPAQTARRFDDSPPGSHRSSPTRSNNPHSNWESTSDPALDHPRRPAPPPMTSSLRDLADSNPNSSSYQPIYRYDQQQSQSQSRSNNSSDSSLIVHPPSNNTPAATSSYTQANHQAKTSWSLLTDPATAAAAGFSVMDDYQPAQPPILARANTSPVYPTAGNGWQGPAASGNATYLHSGGTRRSNDEYPSNGNGNSSASRGDERERSGSGTGSAKNDKESQKGEKEKGSTIKGVFGNFLCEHRCFCYLGLQVIEVRETKLTSHAYSGRLFEPQ